MTRQRLRLSGLLPALVLAICMLAAAAFSRLAAAPTPSLPVPGAPPKPGKPKPGPDQNKPKGGPEAPHLSRRVVLISLDGAGAEELRQLNDDDRLSGGGFSRFFREGEVAEGLVPVNPTLTAPNHVSLATGFPPDRTGIVGNHFHLPASPWTEAVSGFDAPIATETLWEAAERQKKKAGILCWPGADGTSDRRRGEWGMTWVHGADHGPELIELSRSDWKPVPPGSHLKSNSPLLAAHVDLGGARGGGTGEPLVLDLVAVDSTNDQKENYDGLVVVPAGGLATTPVAGGAWGSFKVARKEGMAGAWFKVKELSPDLSKVRVYVGGLYRNQAYPDNFAQDLLDHGAVWPGPPDGALLAGEEPDLATWGEEVEHFAAFFGEAVKLGEARPDWDLLLAYIPVLDEAEHRLLLTDPRQPGFSKARRDAYAKARLTAWRAVDRELRRILAVTDLPRTTVVVVSDHGMAPVHTALDANALLREHELAPPASNTSASEASRAENSSNGTGGADDNRAPGEVQGGGGSAGAPPGTAWAVADGGIAHVYLAPGLDAAAASRALARLRDLFTGWKAPGQTQEPVLERVLTRDEAAALGLAHPASGDLILFAREGYAFETLPAGGPAVAPSPLRGTHGYLASHPDMHAIYMAIGAGIKPSDTLQPEVQATDVAARIASWLGIEKPRATPPPATHH